MGRTACTEPQCLYKGALYVLPLHLHPLPQSYTYASIHGRLGLLGPADCDTVLFRNLITLYQWTRRSVSEYLNFIGTMSPRPCTDSDLFNIIPAPAPPSRAYWRNIVQLRKLRGLSPRANYTDRAAAAGRRS